MVDELDEFIRSNPDARELKRAVAVQMVSKGYKHREIAESISVSSGFISKWTQRYQAQGMSGLKLAYRGSRGYLAPEQRQAVIDWLRAKNYWNLAEMQAYIEQEYEVVFDSKQSYYTLFAQAGISWKKTQKRNPKTDPVLVEKKHEIMAWLEAHRDEIVTGALRVFFADECHLLWGDVCGYVWGRRDERIEVPIVNERCKQTYYGAVDICTRQCLTQAAEAGNSEGTIAFLDHLLKQAPASRMAVIWDGATYHRSQEVRAYLQSLNHGLDESAWKLTCLRFAPNDPTQNPIEDIWLQAKRWIRECYHLCQSFKAVKVLFELVTHRQTFNFPKLFSYGCFS
jgi:putative transposase